MRGSLLGTRSFATLGFLVLTPTVPGRDAELAFTPEADTSISKTFRTENNIDLDDFELSVDSNDVRPMLGELGVNVVSRADIVITDEYLEVEEGLPTLFARTFDELGASSETTIDSQFASDRTLVESHSVFEDTTVQFEWSAEDEAYEVELVDGELVPDLLDGLVAEADLRFLLPEVEVAEGDEWEVEFAAFGALLAPGGELQLQPDEVPDFDGLNEIQERLEDRADELWGDVFAGSATCTFLGVEEEEELSLAVVELEGELETSIDLVPIMEEIFELLLDEMELPQEIEFEFDILEFTIALQTTGELRWNLAEGQLHSLELTTDGKFELELSMVVDAGDNAPTVEGNFGFSMTQENSVTVES